MERIRLKNENQRLKENLLQAQETEGFHGMIGRSAAIRTVCEKITKIAALNSTVLITGKTGTGKELVARAIHRLSGRPAFVSIDLGTLTDELAASELFGHTRGAFTGAVSERRGKIEAAGDGTVFLDEIENTSMDIQQKLLRVMDQHEYQKVGGDAVQVSAARFLAATNVDLQDQVAAGRFREDLYHRLNVINIQVPALQERPDDVELLARYFLSIHSKSMDIYKEFAPQALHALRDYAWPGNVRELKNAIEEALIFGMDQHLILPEDFKFTAIADSGRESDDQRGRPQQRRTLKQAESEAKKSVILQALQECDGVMSRAARYLDVTPRHLSRLMGEYRISSGPDNPV